LKAGGIDTQNLIETTAASATAGDFLDCHDFLCKANIAHVVHQAPDLFDGQEILTVICSLGPMLVHRSNQPGIDRQSELKDGAAW